ncbi:MAG: hypothetical protein KDA89_22280, partial [Planctomycetaceae bacterium]|nr:hypothetical protein [Planctomycetaceae bacterium]
MTQKSDSFGPARRLSAAELPRDPAAETLDTQDTAEGPNDVGSGSHAGSPSNGRLIPVEATPTYIPGPPMVQPQDSGNAVFWAALGAFRRRWFVATSLGLFLGCAAAAAAWQLVPAPYTSFAELHIESVEQRILFKTAEAESNFNTYKQTQMRQITSPFVLTAAIREPEIAALSMLRQEQHPVEWLEEEIQVSSPGTEFIRVSLTGDQPTQLQKIVAAVAESYLAEVVHKDHEKRSERKANLERIYRDIEDRLRSKKNAVKKLAEALHTGDSQALTVKQQMAYEYYRQLQKEFTQIRFDLMRAEVQLATHKSQLPQQENIQVSDALVDKLLQQNQQIVNLGAEAAKYEKLVESSSKLIRDSNNPILVGYRRELSDSLAELSEAREKLRPVIIEELKSSAAEQTQTGVAELENTVNML